MKERGHFKRALTSRIMLILCGTAAAVAVIVLALILGYTLFQGISYVNLSFFTNAITPVGEPGGGMRNELVGSGILVGLGSVIAIPIGLMAGIFLSEFGGRKTSSVIRFVADILAGVPSIIVGVFAYAILVKPLRSYSAISAAIGLSIIMIPIVARTAEESLKLVPRSMREAALALGITRWRAVVSVIIPGAMTGIVTGVMLAVARIAGETAPLLFTALGSNFGFDGLNKPITALPLKIYQYATSPYKDQQQQAWAGAFVLVMLILIISILVRWLTSKRRV